jgi:hypothetical protein
MLALKEYCAGHNDDVPNWTRVRCELPGAEPYLEAALKNTTVVAYTLYRTVSLFKPLTYPYFYMTKMLHKKFIHKAGVTYHSVCSPKIVISSLLKKFTRSFTTVLYTMREHTTAVEK